MISDQFLAGIILGVTIGFYLDQFLFPVVEHLLKSRAPKAVRVLAGRRKPDGE